MKSDLLARDWLIRKISDPVIEDSLRLYSRGRLLDIGCGRKPFEPYASQYVTEYVGLDHPETLHTDCRADVWAEANSLPFEEQVFDTVFCIAVLEHLPDPGNALEEACRILRHGGYAIYTAPLFWHLHEEPWDFYRYTRHGLRHLFEDNGFEVVEVRALSGFLVTFGQELIYWLWRFRRGGPPNPLWWLVPVIGAFLSRLIYLLNRYDSSEEFTWAYIVIARKP